MSKQATPSTKKPKAIKRVVRPLQGNLQDLAYQYFLATDWGTFKAITNKVGIYDSEYMSQNAMATCITYDDYGVAIICIKEGLELSLIETFSLLVHEAVHLWQAHCEYIGEEAPGDEIEAYAIQKIATELMKEYMNTRKEIDVPPKEQEKDTE